MSIFSETNSYRRRVRHSTPTSSPTKPAKQLFSSGSPRKGICAISKRWNNNTSPITARRWPNWRRSSAQISIFSLQQRQRNKNEIDNSKDFCARAASRKCRLLKIQQINKAAGRRLLHWYHAPIGACRSAGQMSDLRNGSRAGDE